METDTLRRTVCYYYLETLRYSSNCSLVKLQCIHCMVQGHATSANFLEYVDGDHILGVFLLFSDDE